MKKALLTIALATIFLASHAQKSVREKDLEGRWAMVFDIEDDLDESWDEDESILGRLIAKSATTFVVELLDEIEITMEFRPNNRLRMEVEVFGEREVEYDEWHINDDGELIIGDWNKDDDDIWLFDGRRLQAYEKSWRGRLKEKQVYLRKI